MQVTAVSNAKTKFGANVYRYDQAQSCLNPQSDNTRCTLKHPRRIWPDPVGAKISKFIGIWQVNYTVDRAGLIDIKVSIRGSWDRRKNMVTFGSSRHVVGGRRYCGVGGGTAL
jgi:hypothetical protein